MKWRVLGQEVDQRKLGQRLYKTVRHKLNREDAMDSNRWRKQIRDGMVDQERCEWVNVSSGTGSPR